MYNEGNNHDDHFGNEIIFVLSIKYGVLKIILTKNFCIKMPLVTVDSCILDMIVLNLISVTFKFQYL